MKQVFISTDPRDETGVTTKAEAEDYAPWATEIIEVDGGYIAFESAQDAETWRNQS